MNQVLCEVELAAPECDHGERATGERVRLVPVDESTRLLVAPLAYTQVGELYERILPHEPVAALERADRRLELGLGLGPAPGGDEDAAVVVAAHR